MVRIEIVYCSGRTTAVFPAEVGELLQPLLPKAPDQRMDAPEAHDHDICFLGDELVTHETLVPNEDACTIQLVLIKETNIERLERLYTFYDSSDENELKVPLAEPHDFIARRVDDAGELWANGWSVKPHPLT